MKRSARFAWLGLLALTLAVVASQTTISPIARAQSEAPPSVAAGANLGTLAEFQEVLQPLGFTGASSPLPDGTARWVATGADGSTAEAIGPEEGLTQVTYAVKVPLSGDSSTQLTNLVTFLTKYSLAGEFFVLTAMGMAPVQSQDLTETIDGRSVHVTATQAADGTDLKVEIAPASGAESSGEPTFSLPSFEIPSFEIPSFAIPSFEIPSFAPDTDLAAKFPQTVDGQPVTDVQTLFYVDLLRLQQTPDSQIEAVRQAFAPFGINLDTVSDGSARATVDGENVRLNALRAAGADASNVIAHFSEIGAALNTALGQPVPSSAPTQTQANVGGKNVTLSTDADGTVTYLYPSGDTIWIISDVTDSQAAKIMAALQ
jgi:hypothetical protein